MYNYSHPFLYGLIKSAITATAHRSRVISLQMDQTTCAEDETKIGQPHRSLSISLPSKLLQQSFMTSRPQIALAEVEHHTNSITLTVKDCDVVIVDQPVGVPHRQSCALDYLEPSANDEATSRSKNRIPESGGISTTNQEIVCKDKPRIPQKCNVCVESDTSIMIKTQQVSDVDRPLPMITKQGYLNGKQCEEIIEKLVTLQDNGKFKEHETLVIANLKLCREKQNFDMELALLLEQGVAFSYHREFKKSKKLFNSVIIKSANHPLRNENLLMARAHYLIVDNYVDRFRKVTEIQSMQECLKKSQLLLQNVDSPQDWAELYYTSGNLGLARLSTMPISGRRHAQARRAVQDDAKHNFELAITCCKKDPRERIQTKLQRYCHLKVAQLLLDTRSTAALHQQNVVPPERIEEAKQHLDFVEGELGNGMPLGTRVELLQTRCDQFYRQEKFQLAKETAEDAYRIVNCNSGFRIFLDGLQERIKLLDSFCESRIRIVVDDDLATSDSDASYEASSSEPE